MKIHKINNISFYIVLFLTFLGFYSVLLIGINFGLSELSRLLTIPMRMLIGLGCAIIFIFNIKKKASHLKYFLFFALIYLIRIFIDILYDEYFYISYTELIFYFVSFCVIPFVCLSKFDFSKIDFQKLYIVFLVSALIFSSLAVIFYGRFLGTVQRLSPNIVGEDVISPLTLSYSSSLIIGVTLVYNVYNKASSRIKILSYLALILSVLPFFLGASRGGIIALFIPFLFISILQLSVKNFLKYFALFILLIAGLIFLDDYFQSGLLNRFFSTSEAIESGGSSAIRLLMWKTSITQFFNNPFFGDKLNTEYFNHYPHNIFIEVLQTTGLIGFIPFLILTLKGIIVSMRIFKHIPQYSWIAFIFLQSLIQYMFSGALYSAAWFWTSLSIILSLNLFLVKKYTSYQNTFFKKVLLEFMKNKPDVLIKDDVQL